MLPGTTTSPRRSGAGAAGELITPFPGQIRGNRDDQIAVGVVVIGPPRIDETDQHVAVQQQESAREQCNGEDRFVRSYRMGPPIITEKAGPPGPWRHPGPQRNMPEQKCASPPP